MIKYYYNYKKNEDKNNRYDLESYSESYKSFDIDSHNYQWVYVKETQKMKKTNIQEPYVLLNRSGKHLTSMKFHNPENPCYAYGDIRFSNDLLLFEVEANSISVFIAPNMKFHSSAVYESFCNGEYEDEIEELKTAARDLINSVNNQSFNND